MNSTKEYNQLTGKLLVNRLTLEEAQKLVNYIESMEALLDEADLEDFFGTEGWKHNLGWEY